MGLFKRKPGDPKGSLDLDGNFTQAERFERIWVKSRVHHKYGAEDVLNDDEYIDYNIWEDRHCELMYEKHLPKVGVMRGSNPNIIFHGGCLGCLSQRLHGIDRCRGCQYFRADWSKPDLSMEGEDSHKLSGDDFIKLLGGED